MTEQTRMVDLPVIDTDVLIVGAGPTGLMAAVVCAEQQVPAVVVDMKEGPTRESRALVVQARTMEIYDQLGLAQDVLAAAMPTVRAKVGAGANPVTVSFGQFQQGATRFPGIQVFEQSRNEQLLVGALHARHRNVLWRHRLIDLVDDMDGSERPVVALLEGPDGLSRVRARWCIGADGAASKVRRDIDVRFDGVTNASTFWLADVHGVDGLDSDTATVRFGRSTAIAIAFPLGPGGHVRLIAAAAGDSITQAEALESARTQLGITPSTVDWFSTYRVHHRVASRFRAGSVFLAGDAGHVHSPVGGQGMNTGLQDAHNLALLLSDVIHGRVGHRALDRYERERRPVAQRLVNVTDRAFGVITQRNPAVSVLRRGGVALLFPLLGRIAGSRAGARLGGYLGQFRIRYHYVDGGQKVPEWAADPAVGLRLPPVDNNHESLRAMTWQLHTYGTGHVDRPEVPAWVEGPHNFAADTQRRLQRDRVYLVRPDGYVAASCRVRADTVDPTQLRSALSAHVLVTA